MQHKIGKDRNQFQIIANFRGEIFHIASDISMV